jgi:hypothetical protein
MGLLRNVNIDIPASRERRERVNRKSKDTFQRLPLFQSGATVLCSCLRADQLKMFWPQRNPGENGWVRARPRLRAFELARSTQSSAFALRIDLAASSQSFSLGLEETRIVVGCCSSRAGTRAPFCDFRHPVTVTATGRTGGQSMSETL